MAARLTHYRPTSATKTFCGKKGARLECTVIRKKVTCVKCLKEIDSSPLPADGRGDDHPRWFDGEVEVDLRKGIIFVRDPKTATPILIVSGLPFPPLRSLAGTGKDFVPQMHLSIRQNAPVLFTIDNMALAGK